MVEMATAQTEIARLCPAVPVLVAGRREACWLSPDGEIETLALRAAGQRARTVAP